MFFVSVSVVVVVVVIVVVVVVVIVVVIVIIIIIRQISTKNVPSAFGDNYRGTNFPHVMVLPRRHVQVDKQK